MLTLSVSGDVADYTPSLRAAIAARIANELDISPEYVTISVAAGSVRLTVQIAVPPTTTVAVLEDSVQQRLGSASAATAVLTDVASQPLTIEATPTVTVQRITTRPKPATESIFRVPLMAAAVAVW